MGPQGFRGIFSSELSNTSQGHSPWADPAYYGLFRNKGITWTSRTSAREGWRINQDVVCLLSLLLKGITWENNSFINNVNYNINHQGSKYVGKAQKP